MIAVIWIVATVFLACWSLFAWGLHTLLVNLPDWAEDPQGLLEHIPFSDWLDEWIPGWDTVVQALLHLADTALSWAGDHAPLLAWAVWAAGALLVFGCAGLVSLVVVLVREKPKKALGAA